MSEKTDNALKIRAAFEHSNPFLSAISHGDPWDNDVTDLETLNAETKTLIDKLLTARMQDMSTPLAGLFLGEAGSGKTHMLKRILSRALDEGNPAVLVNVRAFLNASGAKYDLFKEVVSCLKKQHRGGRTQLDMLMEKLNEVCLSMCKDTAGRIKTLRKEMPGVNIDLLKCFLCYSEHDDPIDKEDILLWLTGKTDEEDAKGLGLPQCVAGIDFDSTDSESCAARENYARGMLISLGQVLTLSRVPMIVCFDQLDGMNGNELINAWGDAASVLINDAKGMLPLAFLRSDKWIGGFSKVLTDAVKQRFEGNKCMLRGCYLEEARQLLENKIRKTFDYDSDNEIEEKLNWLWKHKGLGVKIKSGYSPRLVIEMANNIIMRGGVLPANDPPETQRKKDIFDTLQKHYDNCVTGMKSSFAGAQPDAGILLSVLEKWLSVSGEFSNAVRPAAVKKKDYISLNAERTVDGKIVKCAFSVMTPGSANAASAAIRQCAAFLDQNSGGCCWYITDERTHQGPARWKVFAQVRTDFAQKGGRTIILGGNARANWYALAELIGKVNNGDIEYLDASDVKHDVTAADTDEWIRECFGTGGTVEGFCLDEEIEPIGCDWEKIRDMIVDILHGEYMSRLAFNTIQNRIFNNGSVDIDSDKLRRIIDHYDDVFFSTDAVVGLVGVKGAQQAEAAGNAQLTIDF